jgi:hypothetical protein
MSSAAQVTANIANSRLSTGPRTGEGKRIASSNSLKHGLTSKLVVIPGEDPEAFKELRASLHADWKPVSMQESMLVDKIAEQAWRLQRARRVETASFKQFILPLTTTTDPDEAIATAFHENSKAFDNLRRYETTIERSYYKALTELRNLQTERRKLEQSKPIGSVSQKQPSVISAASALNQSEAPMVKLDTPWTTRSSVNKPYTTLSTAAYS